MLHQPHVKPFFTTVILFLLTFSITAQLNPYVSNCIENTNNNNQLSKLCNPTSTSMTQQAPDNFITRFSISQKPGPYTTSSMSFSIHVERSNAPHAADRFYNMVINDMFTGQRFYRVVSGWVAQFGVNGEPAVSAVYNYLHNVPGSIILPDPVILSNTRGTLAYSAAYDPNTNQAVNMTSELFINFNDNSKELDKLGFAPFATISLDAMDSVENHLYNGYGELPSICKAGGTANPHNADSKCDGPNENRVYSEGNRYLAQSFPRMTWIQEAKIINPSGQTGDGGNGNGETGDDASATVVLIAICVAIFLLGGAALFVYVYCKGDATCYPLTKGMFFNDGRDENSGIEESFTELPIEK